MRRCIDDDDDDDNNNNNEDDDDDEERNSRVQDDEPGSGRFGAWTVRITPPSDPRSGGRAATTTPTTKRLSGGHAVFVPFTELTFTESRQLDSGRFGQVAVAHYAGQQVAVKFLLPLDSDSAASSDPLAALSRSVAYRQMMSEVEILQLGNQGPHIVRFYGYTVHPDDYRLGLIMERANYSLAAVLLLAHHSQPARPTPPSSPLPSSPSSHSGASSSSSCSDSQLSPRFASFLPDGLKRSTPLPDQVTPFVALDPLKTDLIVHIAEALRYLHDVHGIIHMDLKPQNVLVFRDTAVTAKLADFGLSLRCPAEHKIRCQPSDRVPGNLCHMAPEVFHRLDFDTRADVYGFGVLCYEILSARVLPTPALCPARLHNLQLVTDDELLQASLACCRHCGASVAFACRPCGYAACFHCQLGVAARIDSLSFADAAATDDARRLLRAMTSTSPAERPSIASVLPQLHALRHAELCHYLGRQPAALWTALAGNEPAIAWIDFLRRLRRLSPAAHPALADFLPLVRAAITSGLLALAFFKAPSLTLSSYYQSVRCFAPLDAAFFDRVRALHDTDHFDPSGTIAQLPGQHPGAVSLSYCWQPPYAFSLAVNEAEGQVRIYRIRRHPERGLYIKSFGPFPTLHDLLHDADVQAAFAFDPDIPLRVYSRSQLVLMGADNVFINSTDEYLDPDTDLQQFGPTLPRR